MTSAACRLHALARFCVRPVVCAHLVLWAGTAGVAAAGDRVAGLVRVNGTPHANVVIWLDGVAVEPPAGVKTAVMDQRNLEFLPHVLAVKVGTRVSMPNSDRVFHNVFSFYEGKPFDLGLYPVGTSKVVTFDRPGLSRIFCNIHPSMAAYLLVVDSAFFAVTDRRGGFAIDGVPPGSYGYHVWRPGHEPRRGTMVVSSGQAVEIDWP